MKSNITKKKIINKSKNIILKKKNEINLSINTTAIKYKGYQTQVTTAISMQDYKYYFTGHPYKNFSNLNSQQKNFTKNL